VTNLLAESSTPKPSTTRPIVIATIARPDGLTGVHTHFNTFLDALREAGHPAKLITPFSGQQRLASAVFAPRRILSRINPDVNVLWYEQGHYRMLKRALARELRGAGELTVYAQCPLSARAALEVRDGPHQCVKMAVHFNGSQADEWVSQVGLRPSSRVYADIRRRETSILPRLDGIVYVSRYMRDRLEASIPGLTAVPSTVVPNFISTAESHAPDQPMADLISIGSLEPRKNQAYLLQVLSEAKKTGHRYSLSLVGDGPGRPGLGALAKDLGVDEQVAFRGQQPNARRLLAGHRAYVHASRIENLPIVLVEALGAGLPIFAADVGGVGEVLSDAAEGRFWDLENPGDGAAKLIAVLEDRDRYEEMSQRARTRFRTHFDPDVLVSRLRDFLVE
jgi:glycosyltransferase involved in cell wall biosynthesis